MKRIRTVLALLTAAALCLGMLAGCSLLNRVKPDPAPGPASPTDLTIDPEASDESLKLSDDELSYVTAFLAAVGGTEFLNVDTLSQERIATFILRVPDISFSYENTESFIPSQEESVPGEGSYCMVDNAELTRAAKLMFNRSVQAAQIRALAHTSDFYFSDSGLVGMAMGNGRGGMRGIEILETTVYDTSGSDPSEPDTSVHVRYALYDQDSLQDNPPRQNEETYTAVFHSTGDSAYPYCLVNNCKADVEPNEGRIATLLAFEQLEDYCFEYTYNTTPTILTLHDCSFVDYKFDQLDAEPVWIFGCYLADVDSDFVPELIAVAGQIPDTAYIFDLRPDCTGFTVTTGECSQLWEKDGLYVSEYVYLDSPDPSTIQDPGDASPECQMLYQIDPTTREFVPLLGYVTRGPYRTDMEAQYNAVPELSRCDDGSFALMDAVRAYID